MELSAEPGVINTGALMLRPSYLISMRSELRAPSRAAVRSFIKAALSQVKLVIGFGNSCSHELFAHRPSNTVGSGRNTISNSPAAGGTSPTNAAAVLAVTEIV